MAETPNRTVFEPLWDEPGRLIYRSSGGPDELGIMAFPDVYPKFPYQVVVAPRYGDPGGKVDIFSLPEEMQERLNTLTIEVGRKLLELCEPDQRIVVHSEGFAVTDHAHNVLFPANRGEGVKIYEKGNLGPTVVEDTLRVVRFTPEESRRVDAKLRSIKR